MEKVFATAITLTVVACQSNACNASARGGASNQTSYASQLTPPVKESHFASATAPAPVQAKLAPAPPGRANHASPIGTNLSDFQDYSAEWSTLDGMKQSRAGISGMGGEWESKEPLDVDEHGWVRSLKPGQIARTLLFWGNQPYPAGDYVVRYEGEPGGIFQECVPVVVHGRLDQTTAADGTTTRVFDGDQVEVKHDNKYVAQNGDRLNEAKAACSEQA